MVEDSFSKESFKESDFYKAFCKGMEKAKKKSIAFWKCENCKSVTNSSKGKYFEYHNKEKWLECNCEGFMKPIFHEEI